MKKNSSFSVMLSENLKKYGAIYAFLILVIANAITNENFLAINTFWNLMIQSLPIILCAMGMLFVISSGGIDISVGSIMAVTGIINGVIINGNYPEFSTNMIVGMLLGIVVACLFGLFNGALIAFFQLQPIVVTLTTYITARGVAELLGGGNILSFYQTPFTEIGVFRLPGKIPIQFIVEVIIILIVTFILKKTVFGYHVQAIGENPNAAYFCGINTKKTICLVYTISAGIASIAGLLVSSRSCCADPTNLGLLCEMDAIASVAIGGTSMSGGKSRIFTTVIAALIIQLITITINMNNIHYGYARILKGIIIIAAVCLQHEKKR